MSEVDADERPSADEDPTETTALRQVELDEALARHFSWRMRLLLVALTTLLFVGALAPTWRPHTDGPSLPGSPQGVLVQVMSNVTSGAVYLDGSKVGTQLPVLLTLGPGKHVLQLDTPPFRRQVCRVTAPNGARDDTCHGL